jgi:ketosteroid isomerase-like protein
MSALEHAIDQEHRALDALVCGDPEPQKRLFSRGDDATLANPFGPPACGWAQVAQTLERVARLYQAAEPKRFERVSGYATADLAYIVEIERNQVWLASGEALVPVALRATTIFRREADGWRVVHRHADPITVPRPPESIATPSPSGDSSVTP